ncbi:MAG: PaaI family thioesterase [Gemmatimonadaceae bacterium]|nr:PaaI family thioesterase [Gemmatimonadaceae bacterium]
MTSAGQGAAGANADAAERIRASFARQSFMTLLGAELSRVERGVVEIAIARRDDLLQQHGFLHAGVLTSLLDSACGYSALTVMDGDSGVMSIEFKVNLLAPAAGDRFLVRGEVLKAGKTVVVCRGDAYAMDGEEPRLVAAMQASMMAVRGKASVRD